MKIIELVIKNYIIMILINEVNSNTVASEANCKNISDILCDLCDQSNKSNWKTCWDNTGDV